MTNPQPNADISPWAARCASGLSWLTFAFIMWVSYMSIPQLLYIDEAFTDLKLGQHNPSVHLKFSDYAGNVGRTTVVRFHHLLATVAVAVPLGAVGAMFLRSRLARVVTLIVLLVIGAAVWVETLTALVFAT